MAETVDYNEVIAGLKGAANGAVGAPIPVAGRDLDTFLKYGTYIATAADATEANHFPMVGVGGVLNTWERNSSGLQEFTPVASAFAVTGSLFFRRIRVNSIWGVWRTYTAQRADNTAGKAIYTYDEISNREQLIFGDTGSRDISNIVDTTKWNITVAKLRRYGAIVEIRLQLSPVAGNVGAVSIFTEAGIIPNGFRNTHTIQGAAGNGANLRAFMIAYLGTQITAYDISAGSGVTLIQQWHTVDPWPKTLPGVADGPIPNT